MDIKTFVFIDLNTNDIKRGSILPKITEVALIAISRRDIGKIPRIVQKFIKICNPGVEVNRHAANHTGRFTF